MRNAIYLLTILAAAVLFGCNREATVKSENRPATHPTATPINLSSEIARAKAGNKLLLMEFGSSDACQPCIELERGVFSTAEFAEYAKSNLVFVRIDSPFKTRLPPDVEATNVLLGSQFEALKYPTFVALDHEGKEFWRLPAKDDPEPAIPTNIFYPKGFIEMLEKLRKKQQ